MRRPLDAATLRAAVSAAGGPWQGVAVHVDVDSTNAEAARHPRAWAVVCSDHQGRGRGRLGRSWDAPSFASVAVSAVLPAGGAEPSMQGWLPLLTGMAMARAVRDLTGATPRLKWPNDLLLRQPLGQSVDGGPEWRKVGGVLCELLAPGGASRRLVVAGVGLNVDQRAEELPVGTATSLALCGIASPVSRENLIAGYLVHLANLHRAWATGAGGLDALRQEYRQECLTLGQQVRLHRADGSAVTGTAVRVDDTGRLVLDGADSPHGADGPDGADGPIAHSAGDVVHLRPAASVPAGTAPS